MENYSEVYKRAGEIKGRMMENYSEVYKKAGECADKGYDFEMDPLLFREMCEELIGLRLILNDIHRVLGCK